MNKYDPNESITCPKCGRTYVAEVMSVKWYSEDEEKEPIMYLSSSCRWWTKRRPLDYEEPT